MVEYKITTALQKIAALRKPIRVVQGSQGASKTVSILMLLINSALHSDNREITIFQAERTKMKRTIIKDFLKIMKSLGLFDENEWNKTESSYNFSNGSFIEFLGLDIADIGKGFRRDILYFNEANRGGITFDTFNSLQSRSAITFLDYNPDTTFWAHSDLIGTNNVDFLILTYKDNEFLPEQEKISILEYKKKGYHDVNVSINDPANVKNEYWANKWRVFGLGLSGTFEGTIIKNYDIIREIPEEAKLLCGGIDFGYSQDPSAAVNIYKINDDVVVDELLFAKGLSANAIYNKLKDYNNTFYADSADPRTIDALHSLGLNIKPVKKGPDSVIAGIDKMRSLNLKVTSNSKNIIEAIRQYSWDTDKNGKFINKPNHNFSDIMDAIRYAIVGGLNSSRGKYSSPRRHSKSNNNKKFVIPW